MTGSLIAELIDVAVRCTHRGRIALLIRRIGEICHIGCRNSVPRCFVSGMADNVSESQLPG